MIITARANEKVKYLRRLLNDKKARQEEGVYVAEGVTLLSDLPSNTDVKSFFIKESETEKTMPITKRFPLADVFILSDDVYKSVSDTVSPSGISAVITVPTEKNVCGKTVVLLDGVSDAGNVGTIIRTAVARGIKTLFFIRACADPYSPKAVRASMGGIFKCNIIVADADAAKEMLQGYTFVVLDMNGEDIFSYKRKGKTVIVVGNEAHGVSEEMRTAATDIIKIPMAENGVESLNASVAAGIAMYLIEKGE